ncbi:MAG: hypothetical protein K8L91_00005, partial [Anaerolineae bacterium]|nr:hypothetical protein [Anaerolineae bacterium]
LHHLRQALLTTHHTAPEHERAIRDLQAATAAAKTDLNAALAPHFTDLEAVNPFHWAIEFPEVFVDEHGQPLDNPGFTIILGNPPWEILKPDLREFYAQFDENIESRYTREKAEKRIAELNAEDPNRLNSYEAQKHRIEESATYFRQSPDYIRQSGGDTATHKLFLERSYHLLNAKGRIGYVVPSGIYSDQGTKDLREMLFSEGRIESLVSLTNGLVGGEAYFPDIHRSFKITFLGAQKGVASDEFAAIFRIDPRGVPKPDELFSVLDNPENWMHVKRDLIMRFDPTDQTIMEFQSPIDYELAEKIYGEWPLLGQDIPNQWNLHFANEFHMANDSHLFNQQHVGFPLYEGKMIHQFESAYDVPRYWIDEATGIADLARSRAAHWYKQYRFAYREIARSTDERTCIAGVIPPNTFAGHTLWVGIAPSEKTLLYYVGIINSFCVDWIVRFKAGTHVTLFLMKSLPIPRLNEGHPTFDAIVRRAAQLTCTRPEFAALWESVMGETWDTSKGVTDSAARQQLRDEIDALVAQLYGLSAAEFEHILGTFPLVFPNTPEGEAKKAKLLATFAHFAGGS